MRALTRPTIRGTSAIDPSSVSRTIDCTNATIRPRTSSATCAPMIVRPVRNAIPANPPTSPTPAIATVRCGASATSTSAQPAATMAVPNSRLCGSLPGQPRRSAHAEREPDEHGDEEHPVRGVAPAEAGGVQRGRADDDAAGGERPDDPDHQPADERRARDEPETVVQQREQPGSGRTALRGAPGDLADAEPDGGGGEQIGQPVEHQRDVRGGDLGRRPRQEPAETGDHREQPRRGDHRDAVGHHQGELVRGLDLVRAAQQVRHRRVLGRDPEQRTHLDEQGGHEQPPQRPDQGDRQEQREAQQVAGDHDAAPVELVCQHAGQGPQHESGQQLGGDDTAEREALGLVTGRELRGERGQREETQPVARRRHGRDEPEATERGDGQHAAHAVRRGRGSVRHAGHGWPGRSVGRGGAGDDRTHPLGADDRRRATAPLWCNCPPG